MLLTIWVLNLITKERLREIKKHFPVQQEPNYISLGKVWSDSQVLNKTEDNLDIKI